MLGTERWSFNTIHKRTPGTRWFQRQAGNYGFGNFVPWFLRVEAQKLARLFFMAMCKNCRLAFLYVYFFFLKAQFCDFSGFSISSTLTDPRQKKSKFSAFAQNRTLGTSPLLCVKPTKGIQQTHSRGGGGGTIFRPRKTSCNWKHRTAGTKNKPGRQTPPEM